MDGISICGTPFTMGITIIVNGIFSDIDITPL